SYTISCLLAGSSPAPDTLVPAGAIVGVEAPGLVGPEVAVPLTPAGAAPPAPAGPRPAAEAGVATVAGNGVWLPRALGGAAAGARVGDESPCSPATGR